MAIPSNPKTAKLSCHALSADGQPIDELCVMAVSVRNIFEQHHGKTDSAGNVAINLPCGYYDLLFFNETHEPVVLAGVAVLQDYTAEVTRPLNQSSPSILHGAIILPSGEAISGLKVELYDGVAQVLLRSVVTDKEGRFEFSECEYGYYLLHVKDQSGEDHWIPVPKPETSIEMAITLAGSRPLHRSVVFESAPTTDDSGAGFSVCTDGYSTWLLTGGEMQPNSVPISTNVPPLKVNIYGAPFAAIQQACVDRRAPSAPFSPARPPAGYYHFNDMTGDSYFLIAILPYLHTVTYSSHAPTINAIEFTEAWAYEEVWPTAPPCG